MILKELYIISLKDKKILKRYVFNEFGVNVILGVAKKDSNGVGKTAMIDSIRMMLGEKIPKDFKHKEELTKRDILFDKNMCRFLKKIIDVRKTVW